MLVTDNSSKLLSLGNDSRVLRLMKYRMRYNLIREIKLRDWIKREFYDIKNEGFFYILLLLFHAL